MNDAFLTLAGEVLKYALLMNEKGINHGKSGNVSARFEDGFIITPTGLEYEALTPQKMVFMRMDGDVMGDILPSSEWRMHRDIYQTNDVARAVIHTHSTHATALACLREAIPPFHYMVAMAGGKDIRCAPYATFGSQDLSDGMIKALEGRKACLLANHGMIVHEQDLRKALNLAVEVENLAEQYSLVKRMGTPILLDDQDMDHVTEKFKTYGKQPIASF